VTDTWYFAYGSNLLLDQKVSRTGAIREARRCRLTGYRFAFNKWMRSGGGVYANIVPEEAGGASATVWGVAYLCDAAAIAELDRYEGVSSGHYRHAHVAVVTDEGDVLHALTYMAGERYIGEAGRPQPEYLVKVIEGARQHGLPEDYIAVIEALGRS